MYFFSSCWIATLKNGLPWDTANEYMVSLHPDEMLSLLIATPDVSPGYLQDTSIIHFSEHGNKNWTAEEALVLNRNDYVTNCSKGNDVSLGKILQFFTGNSELPAAGFHTTLPSILQMIHAYLELLHVTSALLFHNSMDSLRLRNIKRKWVF